MPRQPASTAPGQAPEGVILQMRPHSRGALPAQTYCVSPDGTVRVLYTQASYSEQAAKGFGAKTPVWRVLPDGPTARRARERAKWQALGVASK